MKKPLITTFCALLILAFNSCEKEVTNIELPDEDPKLVVYCYLTPSDSLIEVDVSKSASFFGKKKTEVLGKPVTGAVVVLSNGQRSEQLDFNPDLQRYTLPQNDNFRIEAGRTYYLKVSAAGGLSCEAMTTVPARQPSNLRVELDSSEHAEGGFKTIKYRIISRWQDASAVNDYYHLAVSLGGAQSLYPQTVCASFLTDQQKNNNNEIVSSCIYEVFTYEGGMSNISPLDSVYLLTTDHEYYSYHESYYRYDDGNPFAEPVQIYSNIKGGLGCFGSYLKQTAPLIR